MIKKIVALIIAICTLSVGVFADLSCEVYSGTVKLSGSFGERNGYIGVALVLKPGYSLTDYYAFSDLEKSYCVHELKQFYLGSAEFETEISKPQTPGVYNVYVNDGKTTLSSSFSAGASCFTQITPWIKSYHLTTKQQFDNGYSGGECGQMMWSLAVSPFDENLLIAGTDTSGIYRSVNGGKSWSAQNSGFDICGTVGAAFDNRDENTVYCLGSPHVSATETDKSNCGIYVSRDKGITWQLKYKTPFYRTVGDLITFDSGSVYVATIKRGILKSSDFGESWQRVGTLKASTSDYITTLKNCGGVLTAVCRNSGIYVYDGSDWVQKNGDISDSNFFGIAENQGTLFVSTFTNIYKSENMGESWQQIKSISESDMAPHSADGKITRLFFDSNNTMFVQLSSVSGNIRVSYDLGNTFKKPEINKDNAFIKDNNGYGAEPFTVSKNGVLYVSLDGEIYKSADGGKSFYPHSSGISGMRAANFWFNEDTPDDMFICTVDRGAIRTDAENPPCVDYSPMEDSTGIRKDSGSKTCNAVCVDPNNKNSVFAYIGGWNSGYIKYSADGGKTYTSTGITDCTASEMEFANDSIIYAGNYISYDGGASFAPQPCIVSSIAQQSKNIAYGVKKISDTEYHLTRTDDYGRTWQEFTQLNINGYQRFTVDIDDANVIYVGGYTNGYSVYTVQPESGTVTREGFSTNNVFADIAEKYNLRAIPIYKVAQNPKNGNHLVCGGVDNVYHRNMPGIFQSFDRGKTWHTVTGITGNADVWTLEFTPNGDKVYIGTSGGTFIFEWEKFAPGEITADGNTVYNTENKVTEAVGIFKNSQLEINKLKLLPFGSFNIENHGGERLFMWENENSIRPLGRSVDLEE